MPEYSPIHLPETDPTKQISAVAAMATDQQMTATGVNSSLTTSLGVNEKTIPVRNSPAYIAERPTRLIWEGVSSVAPWSTGLFLSRLTASATVRARRGAPYGGP